MPDQTAYQSNAIGEITEGDSKNVDNAASATNQQYQPLQAQYPPFFPYQWDPSGQQYPPYQHFPFPQDLYSQAPFFKGDSQPSLVMGGPYQQTTIKEDPSQGPSNISKDEPTKETNAMKSHSQQTTIKEEPKITPDMLDPYQKTIVKEEPNTDPYNQTHLKSDPSHGIPNISNYYNFQFPHFYPPVNFGSDLINPDSAKVANSNNSSQDSRDTSTLNLSSDINNASDTNSSLNSSKTSSTRDSFSDTSYSNTSVISSRNSSSGYDSAGDLDRSWTNQMHRTGNHQIGNNVSPGNAGRNNAVNSDETGLEKSDWKEDISSVPPGWKIQKIFSSGNHIKTMVMSPEGKIFPSRKEAFIYMESHLKQPRKSTELPKRKEEQKKSIDNNFQPLSKKIKISPPKEALEKQTVTFDLDLERRKTNSGLDPDTLSKMKARGQQPAVIWDYFAKIEGSTDARCLYCNVSVIRPLATTTKMIGHLRAYHKNLYPTYEIHQKEAREKTKFNSSPKHTEELKENLPVIGDLYLEVSKGVPPIENEPSTKSYPEQGNFDNKKSLPFKIPSSIEISLVNENSKVETTETKKIEQTVLKEDPIDIMENDPYGPKISLKLNSFEKVCSVFLTNPNPPPSVIFGISDNNKMPMEDVKWMFIKLRKIFQYKGKSVDEVSLRRLVSHVNFTHQHATYFEF